MESRLLSPGRAGERDRRTSNRLASLAESNNHAGESKAREQEGFLPQSQGKCLDKVQAMRKSCCERKGAERKQNSQELRYRGVRAPEGVK